MANEIFLSAGDATRRYGKDIRTLKAWARNGYVLYQVIGAGRRKQEWLFESPEARYDRVMGIV